MNDESFLKVVKISDFRILSGWIEKHNPLQVNQILSRIIHIV